MASAAFGMRRIADLIEKKTSPVAIIGNKGVEAGIAVKLVESDSNYKLFDGIFLAGYGGTRKEYKDFKKKIPTVGFGVGRAFKNIGMGVYVTQNITDFLNKKNINVGAGLSLKF